MNETFILLRKSDEGYFYEWEHGLEWNKKKWFDI